MTDIAFYHLQRSALESALPKLLEKTLEAGERAVVMAGSEDRVEALNGVLWTYHQDSWLPHGSARDGHAEAQPVWL
ncbi:MAG: DNA polymerase III subunit chi, partial [Rhodospirillales bacterium]|nr:DNA polymerase III subunit chi [Rhodospirillales bacterium]